MGIEIISAEFGKIYSISAFLSNTETIRTILKYEVTEQYFQLRVALVSSLLWNEYKLGKHEALEAVTFRPHSALLNSAKYCPLLLACSAEFSCSALSSRPALRNIALFSSDQQCRNDRSSLDLQAIWWLLHVFHYSSMAT